VLFYSASSLFFLVGLVDSWVAIMKPSSRSRSGPARDQGGRFISREYDRRVETGPSLDNQKGAAAVVQSAAIQAPVLPKRQVVAAGIIAPVALPEDEVASDEDEQVAAEDSEEQDSSDDDEVSAHESDENDSDNSSDSDNEEEEELEGTGKQIPDLVNADKGKLADQVFDQMPQPNPTDPGVKLGSVKFAGGPGGGCWCCPEFPLGQLIQR